MEAKVTKKAALIRIRSMGIDYLRLKPRGTMIVPDCLGIAH